MKAFASVAIAGLIAATSLTTTVTPADAGGNKWKHNKWSHNNNWNKPHYHNKKYNSKGWNPGAALATGAILGLAFGALATPKYYYPPKVYTYAPPPPPPPPAYPSYEYGYEYGYGPTDPQHVSWCSRRYRSYNVEYNTWIGYDGLVHQCISPYS